MPTKAERPVDTEERLALLYSDGSLGIFTAGRTLDSAREDALLADDKENDPEHFTKVVKVEFRITEVVETPKQPKAACAAACPTCGRGLATKNP